MPAESLWSLADVSLAPKRLRGITLDIPHGVTAVIGWSGAGKTSLLNLLVDFEKPDAGKIAGAPRVAWVPQNGGLWPHCTVREHLEITRCSSGDIDALLTAFDLEEKERALPHELSEGEQSRLSVARALSATADVLVMDEPLVHVDPARVGKYWQVIREHLARTGASLVFSTHEPEAALGEAEHVVCLAEGRVLHAGQVAELYANPPTQELMGFLGAGNWFTPEDAARFGVEANRCIRPERLAIQPAQDSTIVVESARFKGSVEEVVLRDSASNAQRTFCHRPPANQLKRGMRVALQLIALCLCALVACACRRDTAPGPIQQRQKEAQPAHQDRHPELLELGDSLASVRVEMTSALRAEITALSRTPAPATDRLEEIKPPRT